jgi:XTP/dITP diphosphohydrolase
MNGVKDRSAQFVCAIALADPAGTIVLETEGICEGEILTQPQGKEGFGYDPVFYLKEIGQTFGEMSAQQKETCSHRGIAFRQLMPILATLSLA